MIVSKIVIDKYRGLNLNLNLAPLTIITGSSGSGKSSVLDAITLLFNNLGRKVNHNDEFYIEYQIVIDEKYRRILQDLLNSLNHTWIDDKISIVLEYHRGKFRQLVKINGEEVILLVESNNESRIKIPIEVEIVDGSKILDSRSLKPRSTTSIELVGNVAEKYGTLMNLIDTLSRYLREISIVKLGPYIDYDEYVHVKDLNVNTDFVGTHGEYTIPILSKIYTNPSLSSELNILRKIMRNLGFKNIKAGWIGDGLGLMYIDKRGKISSKLPCHAKTILSIGSQLIILKKPSILIIDNADYCLDSKSAEYMAKLITSFIGFKKLQAILEIHNQELLKYFTGQYTIIHNIG